MASHVTYSPRERLCLWALAAAGLVGINGAFLYAVMFRPESIAAVRTNPLAAAFVVEALVLVGVFAYLLRKWEVSRLHWGWFVVLSLLGSIAFALPVALLWPAGNTASAGRGRPRQS